MRLKSDVFGHQINPKYVNGGAWMPLIRRQADDAYSNAFLARVVRSLLNHAPIGEYYQRFNIPDTLSECPCGVDPQTRDHIFVDCPCFGKVNGEIVDALDVKVAFRHVPEELPQLIEFLTEQPLAFSFTRPDPPEREGDSDAGSD